MDLGSLQYAPGSKQEKKRVGRGDGNSYGNMCGRGTKGYYKRSGSEARPWFEGGTMPLYRRLPKIGFTNNFSTEYQPINIKRLNKLDVEEVNPQILAEKGWIKNEDALYKILGEGELEEALTVKAPAFSKSAKKKIEESGGEAKQL